MRYVSSVERFGREEGLQQGLQQGMQQGLESERQMLARLTRRRFGAEAAEQSRALLARISEPLILEELGENLLDCADSAAWLALLTAQVAGIDER